MDRSMKNKLKGDLWVDVFKYLAGQKEKMLEFIGKEFDTL